MSSPMDDDIDRDAWLREALRHAPDATLAPPPDLSDAILRAAQANARAAAPPVARRRPSWGQRLWMWLAQPSVGAGLATVMIGSVVVTMWWDRPLPEPAARHATTPVAQAPRENADAAATAPAPAAAPPVATATAPAPEARRRESAPADDTLRRRTPPARAETPAADAARGAAAGAPTPPPAPAVAANDAATQAVRTGDAMVPATPALALSEAAPAPPAAAPSPSRPAARTLAKSGAAPAAESFLAADSDLAAMARAFIAMRLAVSTESQRWTWQRRGTAPQPIGDALTAWLAELDAATAMRWRQALPHAPTPPPTLQLLREGRVVHRLWLEGDELHWESADAEGGAATARVAPIAPERALALREALSRIVR